MNFFNQSRIGVDEVSMTQIDLQDRAQNQYMLQPFDQFPDCKHVAPRGNFIKANFFGIKYINVKPAKEFIPKWYRELPPYMSSPTNPTGKFVVENYEAKLNADDEEVTAIKKFDATEITWLLVKTVQEQQALITALTTRITALESAT
jgi:hypothetical protein